MREPYLADPDVTLYHGDALETLRGLPDGCVDMVATSPPFYGLRDYGTGTWEGGDEGCDHSDAKIKTRFNYALDEKQASNAGSDVTRYRSECPCGARRVDRQIGLEETPDQWVQNLVAVFRECRRVLADHGTLWVEIGDSYAANRTYQVKQSIAPQEYGEANATRVPEGMKQKDLMGMPWELAFALRADGWWLRSEIIWARPNPMPESVTDRPTKSHSTVFLLSKQPRYFFDADAIREAWTSGRDDMRTKGVRTGLAYLQDGVASNHTLDPSLPPEKPRGPDGRRATRVQGQDGSEQHRDGERWPNPDGANARSVWTISTEATSFTHYATWPRALVQKMILAGTSEVGICPVCRAPWVRQVEAEGGSIGRDWNQRRDHGKDDLAKGHSARRETVDGTYRRRIIGWEPTCAHGEQPVPAVVLDPFAGSGTTLLVARQLGRHAVGIELNPEYCELAGNQRLAQQSLFA